MNSTESTEPKQRPKIFLALGHQGVPQQVTVNELEFELQKLIKHDSWAATAIYGNPDSRVVVKFNRIQPVFFVPMRWLGRWLAGRESAMYDRLKGVPRISTGYREVFQQGRRLPNACAHEFIEGHPLSWQDRVDETFFDQISETLTGIHQRNVAYVDLNKWENIIIDSSGDPWLIDFQISVKLPKVWPFKSLLRMLQDSDLYHLAKHASRIRPDLYPEHKMFRPWWIKLHRRIANPIRAFRRRLLVATGVRSGQGKPQSEAFVEEGLRETHGELTPITRLYELLNSESYISYADERGKGFVDTLFLDLIGRPPNNHLEQAMVDRLGDYPRHDQIVWLMKSRLFNVVSNRWEEGFMNEKMESIMTKLESTNVCRLAG